MRNKHDIFAKAEAVSFSFLFFYVVGLIKNEKRIKSIIYIKNQKLLYKLIGQVVPCQKEKSEYGIQNVKMWSMQTV